MKKKMMNFTDIFQYSNLNEQSFYIANSNFNQEEKDEIVQIIVNNNGVSINFINYIKLYFF